VPAFPGVDFSGLRFVINDEGYWPERRRGSSSNETSGSSRIPQSRSESRWDSMPQWGALGFFFFWRETSKLRTAAEMSNVAYGLVMQELERGESVYRSFVPCRAPW